VSYIASKKVEKCNIANWNSYLHLFYKVSIYSYSMRKKAVMQRGKRVLSPPKMPWSQDIVVSILLPYLLPSFPVYKNESWSTKNMRRVFEELLMFHCHVPTEKTQDLLRTFIRRVLSISSSCDINLDDHLDDHLDFLADIKKRCSFNIFYKWKSSVHSLYASTFLIEHRADVHEDDDYALRLASINGHKDTVTLLLQHNANLHAKEDQAFRHACSNGQEDTVALLLQHKANVHAMNNYALRWASRGGHKDIVALLLEHKADVHANDDEALRLESLYGCKDIVALLLEHKADVHANDDEALRSASRFGHKDTIALLLQHNAHIE
jgi:hypothetical protein